jgi:hypothetical protein
MLDSEGKLLKGSRVETFSACLPGIGVVLATTLACRSAAAAIMPLLLS